MDLFYTYPEKMLLRHQQFQQFQLWQNGFILVDAWYGYAL